MCRMLVVFGPREVSIPGEYLQRFVRNCRWGNRRVQDWTGHHASGWGVSWLDPDSGTIRVKRTIRPIWNSGWRDLLEVRSRLVVLHARKSLPWKRKFEDVHPITHDRHHYVVHNGIISLAAIPVPSGNLGREFARTKLDTRRYLLSVLDSARGGDILEGILRVTRALDGRALRPSANAFFFGREDLYVVSHFKRTPLQVHTYQLYASRLHGRGYCVSSVPLPGSIILPNHAVLHYGLVGGGGFEFHEI
ncbi:MAG: class II glutamine amidotransferase [Promethearchaeota archaeon]